MRHVELTLLSYQKEFIRRVNDPLVILCAGVSAGKTRAAAVWVILECLKKKSRIIAGAQTHNALEKVLFREIEMLLRKFGVNYKYNKGQYFQLENGSEIFGATNENPVAVLGFTDIDGAIIDEAAYASEDFFNYTADRLRGENIKTPKIRLITSPSNALASKWFKDLCMKHPDAVIHATSLENKYTSDEFKQQLIDRYGLGTPLYRQQVLGEFIETDTSDALITPDKFVGSPTLDPGACVWIGVDIARFGVDRTCIIVRDHSKVVDMSILHQADSHAIISEIKKLSVNRNVKRIYLDGTGGYSSGVYDILKMEMDNVFEVNFGGKSPDDLCSNNRAYMYRKLKEAIESGFYVKDKDLIEEICAQRLKLNNSGLFQLVPKEDVKEYLGGKSPDLSDALALSFYSNEKLESQIASAERCQQIASFLFR